MEEGKSPAPFSKTEVVNFVRDMAEMEEREFALRKTAEEMKNHAGAELYDAKGRLEKAKKQHDFRTNTVKWQKQAVDELTPPDALYEPIMPVKPVEPEKPANRDSVNDFKKDFEKYEKQVKNNRFKRPKFGDLFWNIIIYEIGTFFVVCIVFLIILAICTLIPPIVAFLAKTGAETVIISFFVIVGIISLIISIWVAHSDYRDDVDFYDYAKNTIETYIMATEQYKADVDEYKKQMKKYESDKKDYEKNINHYKSAEKEYYNQVDKLYEAETEYKNALAAFECEEEKHNLITKQVNILNEKAEEISNMRGKLYGVGIVPPDYRTVDSMIMINSIFKNDLADTMRDAILLYEDRVFKGEVLKGIRMVYSKLDELGHSMIALKNSLSEIRSEIRTVSNELYEISDALYSMSDRLEDIHCEQRYASNQNLRTIDALFEKIDDTNMSHAEYQQAILKETQATRYAMESLNYSSQKYDWYMEQYRQRLL